MPKILRVRAAHDEQEEKQVRKLAGSRHGPADWILHARMVVRSWDGERVEAIAKELQCSPQTVRRRLHRFDAEGIEGLGDRPKPGRPRHLTTEDDSRLIALVRQAPPGRLVTQRDGTMVARAEEGEAQWSLNALTRAAKEAGIIVKRERDPSHPLTRARALASHAQLGHASRQGLRPKRTAVVAHYTEPPAGSTTICTDELGPVVPRSFDPIPGWSTDGHRIKAPLDYGRDPEKTWVYGALRVRDGKALTRCAASRNSKGYIALLAAIEADNPKGDLFIITDNLSSHSSLETRTWLEGHPRIQHVFIPTGACWLNAARRAGGASSAAMHWPGKVLPIPKRSNKPRVSRLRNSTGAPTRGSGDVLPRIIVTIADSFVIAFKELSTNTTVTVRVKTW
jgi:transposase